MGSMSRMQFQNKTVNKLLNYFFLVGMLAKGVKNDPSAP